MLLFLHARCYATKCEMGKGRPRSGPLMSSETVGESYPAKRAKSSVSMAVGGCKSLKNRPFLPFFGQNRPFLPDSGRFSAVFPPRGGLRRLSSSSGSDRPCAYPCRLTPSPGSGLMDEAHFAFMDRSHFALMDRGHFALMDESHFASKNPLDRSHFAFHERAHFGARARTGPRVVNAPVTFDDERG